MKGKRMQEDNKDAVEESKWRANKLKSMFQQK